MPSADVTICLNGLQDNTLSVPESQNGSACCSEGMQGTREHVNALCSWDISDSYMGTSAYIQMRFQSLVWEP